MHSRRPRKNIIGRLAASIIALGTMLGATPASAEGTPLCNAELSQHVELRQALDLGGSWTAAQDLGQGPAPTLRFADIGGCAYVMAPGWDWFSIEEFDGAYQGHARRRRGNTLEVVILEFRFVGTHIEYALLSEPQGPVSAATRTTGTLFHRP